MEIDSLINLHNGAPDFLVCSKCQVDSEDVKTMATRGHLSLPGLLASLAHLIAKP